MAYTMDDFIRYMADSDNPNKEAILAQLRKESEGLGPNASSDEVEAAIFRALNAAAEGAPEDDEPETDEAAGFEAESDPAAEDDEFYIHHLSDQVEAFFKKKDWHYDAHPYDSDGDRLFTLGFNLEYCSLRVRVLLEKEQRTIRIEVILPCRCETLYDYLVSKAIVDFNYRKRFGSLHYDMRDGEISYRYSYLARHGFYEDDFDRYFNAVLSTGDDAYPVVSRLCVGRLKRADLDETMKKLEALVKDLMEEE